MGIKEILWIYQKQSNLLSDAHDLGIKWWDDWNVVEDGDTTTPPNIGQRYGATVKKYDLINNLLKSLKEDPFSRRHIMSLFQEDDLRSSKGLYPCAYETVWSVRKSNDTDETMYLDLHLNQRSSDYIMANFINKIQYVSLQMMIASHLGYKVGKFSHLVNNLHIYNRHIDAAHELLERTPFVNDYPILELKENKDFYDYTIDDFTIKNIKGIEKLISSLEIAI
jgi:thymidylate synthase